MSFLMFKSSIIVSASSKIKYFNLSTFNAFLSQIRSLRRPGVPTTIYGFTVSIVQIFTDTGSPPPQKHSTFTLFINFPNLKNSSRAYWANSLVCVITRHSTLLLSVFIVFNTVSTNTAVFPVPALAQQINYSPNKAFVNDSAWTLVGCSNPASLTALKISSLIERAAH